ncbi:glycosyltransferase family 4 protein [Chryseobacterium gotjawalense]|uniref:Glycosyltransferase family 4 protein n=1 Tax=Chryseobacterium gotjawalense TaxID=3042315 RepID=A0ABY8RE41_9FLAO|nr:glycosyltransferase family 4 protein [Chryseobacterium sp. wdc7]WHF51438.1 glycosyltransferase family 4 protein [Chryseobacterium sp. wdc7]
MKLLYITNGITGSGGLERVLSVKASMLAEDFGYEVHVLSLNEVGKEPFFPFSNKVQQHSITVTGNPIQYFLHYKKGIQKVVDKFKPDLISVCDDGLKGFFVPRLISTNAKWIYERHVSKLIENSGEQNIFLSLKMKSKWKMMEYLAKNFSKFVVLTEGNCAEWSTLKNLIVIGNPLPFTAEKAADLEEKIVICVGKISYQKGQDLLLQIWEKVAAKHPEWQLHLYGNENKQFLNTDRLPDNVSYFPATKNLKSIYSNSSIYVMSSRFEGFGMVLIEAMEFGVPCVSFDCNYGPSDIITDNEDGFLIENGDIVSFANQIIALIENTYLRKKMGEKAQENVQRYSAKKIVFKWNKLFNELTK